MVRRAPRRGEAVVAHHLVLLSDRAAESGTAGAAGWGVIT